MAVKAGFVGPFSDANLGDYGMLVNNILDLETALSSIVVFTYDDNFVSKLISTHCSDNEFRFCGIVLEDDLLEDAKEGARLSPIEILKGITNYAEIEECILAIDVLVVNGGGYFNELWCQPHRIDKMLQILAVVLVADDLGKPIVFTGNSYGPFGERSEFLKELFPALRNARFFARDRVGSTAELRKIGIPEEKISFVPDDLFILNSRIQGSSDNPVNLPDDYVVVETYQPVELLQQNRKKIAEFDRSIRERKLEIVQLPMYQGRGGGDQAAWLAGEFGWIETPNPNGFLPLDLANQVVAGAKFMACERYHGLVLALANGIPVLHSLRSVMGDKWYYHRKSLGILDTALHGANFRQRDFMSLDPFEAFERVGKSYEQMRKEQSKLFDSVLSGNVSLARNSRKHMLDLIIELGGNDANQAVL